MTEVAYAGEDHCHLMLVGGGDYFLIPDTATGLNNRFRASLGHDVKIRRLTSGLHGIEITPDDLVGGADPRREGIAMGE